MRCGGGRRNRQKLQVGELVARDVDTRLLYAELGLRRMHNDLRIDLRVIPACGCSGFRDDESSQRSGETERRLRERFDEIHPGFRWGRWGLKQTGRVRRNRNCGLAERGGCCAEKKNDGRGFHSTPLGWPNVSVNNYIYAWRPAQLAGRGIRSSKCVHTDIYSTLLRSGSEPGDLKNRVLRGLVQRFAKLALQLTRLPTVPTRSMTP